MNKTKAEVKKSSRPNWEEYFFNIAEVVKTRSTCLRRQVGAVAVRDKKILCTGYNGAPTGMTHCADRGGCLREHLKVPSGEQAQKCLAIHAEENLIVQAAYHGISLKGCIIFCTTQPCIICLKKIISLQPRDLYYTESYPDKEAIDLLYEAAFFVEKNSKFTHWSFYKSPK